MKQYLLGMYQPDGPTPPPEVLDRVMRDLGVINQDIKDAGGWVFSGGLHPASTATVLKLDNGQVVATDGPFAEAKEYLGGFWIIKAPDLDVALKLATEGSKHCNRRVEVRPFMGD